MHIYTSDQPGKLTDVTARFSYDEDADVFYTRTRSLTTYILSDRAASAQ